MAQFPQVKFQTIDFDSVSPVVTNKARSGAERHLRREAHYFRFTLKLIPMKYLESRNVHAFLNSLQGKFKSFDVVLPLISDCQGAATVADGQVNAIINSTLNAYTVEIGNLKPSVNKAFKAGDPLRFANHSKVYQIVEDADTDSSGRCQVTLHDYLHSSVYNGEVVIFDQVPFTVRKERDTQALPLSPGQIVSYELDCREVI